MKLEFDWVTNVKATKPYVVETTDPKKNFYRRKIYVITGKEFYTIILNGAQKFNVDIVEVEERPQDLIDQVEEIQKPQKTTKKHP